MDRDHLWCFSFKGDRGALLLSPHAIGEPGGLAAAVARVVKVRVELRGVLVRSASSLLLVGGEVGDVGFIALAVALSLSSQLLRLGFGCLLRLGLGFLLRARGDRLFEKIR